MKPEERQKLCTSCEGRIPLVATMCPYCGAEQGSFAPRKHTVDEPSLALYPPLYSTKQMQSIEEPPAADASWTKTDALGAPTLPQQEEAREEEGRIFWPILLLSLGGNLFVLGILQLCFSEEGALTLEWKSHFWYTYCFVALPLLWFGWKALKKSDPEETS